MARTPVDAASIHSIANQGVNVDALARHITFDDSDNANGNEFTMSEGDLLLVRNNDVGAQTVTITAAADSVGRTGAITTYALAADAIAIFGPLTVAGWKQTGGELYIDTSDDNVQLAIIRAN